MKNSNNKNQNSLKKGYPFCASWLIFLTLLLICGVCFAKTPFAIRAGKALAKYANANSYTASQIRNATPEQVFTHIGIEPNSVAAKKYITMEKVIKGHAINFLGLSTPLTVKQQIQGLLFRQCPNATITRDINDPNIFVIDLDGGN